MAPSSSQVTRDWVDTWRPSGSSASPLNLLATGRYFDIAVRDVAMAIAAFTLARLTEAGVGVEAREPVGTPSLLESRRKITA